MLTSTAKTTSSSLANFKVELVVEDGSGKANAQTYLGLDQASSYLRSSVDQTDWIVADVEDQRRALIAATEYLDHRFRFYGQTLTTTQALSWPRTKNYDWSGAVLDAGIIPEQLKRAAAYLALRWLKESGLNSSLDESGPVRSVTLDSVRVSFDPQLMKQSYLNGKRFPEVELMLRSIGELKDTTWFETKKTEVRR